MLTAACVGLCFVTAVWVSAAPVSEHARVASKSVGTVRNVDGVMLLPIDRSERAGCIKLARMTGGSAPCPRLSLNPIPVLHTAPYAQCLGLAEGEAMCGAARYGLFPKNQFDGPTLQIEQANFQVPKSYTGMSGPGEQSIDGGPLGYFIFVVSRVIRREHFLYQPGYCKPQHLKHEVKVHGDRATLYQCGNVRTSPGLFELYLGAEMLEWREDGFICQVSFNGHSAVNRALDVAVAKSVQLVRAH